MVAQLAGEWHYAGEENGMAEDIWVSFAEDGTFEIRKERLRRASLFWWKGL